MLGYRWEPKGRPTIRGLEEATNETKLVRKLIISADRATPDISSPAIECSPTSSPYVDKGGEGVIYTLLAAALIGPPAPHFLENSNTKGGVSNRAHTLAYLHTVPRLLSEYSAVRIRLVLFQMQQAQSF